MKGKHFIIPILVITLVTVVAAPPAHADFVTLSVVLAAAFISTALVVENTRDSDNEQTAKAVENTTAGQVMAENATNSSDRP